MKTSGFYIPYILLLIFLVSCSQNKIKEDKKDLTVQKIKVILDIDTGIDDAMALAYVLGNPEVELIGITTVFGNVSRNTSVKNTLGLLKLLGHEGVPVYSGADRPPLSNTVYEPDSITKRIHGRNGVGNAILPPSNQAVEKENAIDFILNSIQKYGKSLIIIAVGPETNLGNLVKRDRDFGKKIGGMVIMGGALIVEGNVNFLAEANIYNDPISADHFFQSGSPFTMVGLDVTRRTVLTKQDTRTWRDIGTNSGKFYADMVDFYIDYSKSKGGIGAALHDPLAAAVGIHPEYVKTLLLPMKVDTTKQGWGRTIGISKEMNDSSKRVVAVAVDLDVNSFEKDFKSTLKELFKKN